MNCDSRYATLLVWSAILPLFFAITNGCALQKAGNHTQNSSYSTNGRSPTGLNPLAQKLNRKGLAEFRAGNLAEAEALFRQALEEDVSFGPAHNNLGQVYLARHQLYLAAWEFEYAANLMPSFPEPVVGQGLAYETGEQLERAVEYYESAYEQSPTNPVVIASLARVRIKLDRPPEEIGFLLDELIMRDGRCEWVEWAKELRQTKYRHGCISCESSEWPQISDDWAGNLPLQQGSAPPQSSEGSFDTSSEAGPSELPELNPPNRPTSQIEEEFESLLRDGFLSMNPVEGIFPSDLQLVGQVSYEKELSDRHAIDSSATGDKDVNEATNRESQQVNFEEIARELNELVQ